MYKGSGQQSSDWEDGGQGSCISTGSEGGQQALMVCDESKSARASASDYEAPLGINLSCS